MGLWYIMHCESTAAAAVVLFSPPRKQAELEVQLVDQEVTRLVEEYIERRVKEVLVSEHVQASLAERLQVGAARSQNKFW